MSSNIFTLPFRPAFDSNGLPVAGAKLYFFLTGTTTKTPVYADAGLTTRLANPVIADDTGHHVPIYLDPAVVYRVRVTNANDVQLGDDFDPYMLASSDVDPGGYSVTDYGADPTGAVDSTAAIQAAINAAHVAGGGEVVFPSGGTFLVAAASVTNGTFTSPAGSFPYPRYTIRIHSNTTLRGNGATLKLSGGRTNPGTMFGHPFWDGDSVENIVIDGLELDGNLENQIIEAYPAATSDNEIWQHGDGVTIGLGSNITVRNCTIHGWRGSGVLIFSQDQTTEAGSSHNLVVENCEFYNNFSCDVGGNCVGAQIHENYFHGDGKWVAAIDAEAGAQTDWLRSWNVSRNIFDFRDGLSPPERTPNYASNSSDALAARRHARRAISYGFYAGSFTSNVYNGNFRDVSFTDNVVYQGVMDTASFSSVDVSRNKFYTTYEDLTHHIYIGPHAIRVGPGGGGNSVTGLINATIMSNVIENGLTGHGIYVSDFEDTVISGNVIRYCPLNGIRHEKASGKIFANTIVDVGTIDGGDASKSCGISLFGGQTYSTLVFSNIIRDTRGGGSRTLTYGIYAAADSTPQTRIENNQIINSITGLINDVVSSTLRWGNNDGATNTIDSNVNVSFGALGVTSALIYPTSGDSVLTIKSANANDRKILFQDTSGLEYIIEHLNDGTFAIQKYSGGVFTRNDLLVSPTGTFTIQGTWQSPMRMNGSDYYWSTAGKLYVKTGSAPSNGTDGTVVGTQT